MNYFLYLTIICVSAMILSTLHVIFAGSASPYLTGLLITLGTAIFAITFDTFILPISSFFFSDFSALVAVEGRSPNSCSISF